MKSFLLSRWRGEAPLKTVFWRDMLAVGTILNILAASIAITLLIFEVDSLIALVVYLAPLPWNLFLFFSVWRCAENTTEAGAWGAKIGAVLWLTLSIVI